MSEYQDGQSDSNFNLSRDVAIRPPRPLPLLLRSSFYSQAGIRVSPIDVN